MHRVSYTGETISLADRTRPSSSSRQGSGSIKGGQGVTKGVSPEADRLHAKVPSYFARRDINTLHIIYIRVVYHTSLTSHHLCSNTPGVPVVSRETLLYNRRRFSSLFSYDAPVSSCGTAKTSSFSPSHAVNHRCTWETSRARQAENTILARRASRADWSARASTLARLRFDVDCRQPRGAAAADGRGCNRRILLGSFARLHAKRTSADLHLIN